MAPVLQTTVENRLLAILSRGDFSSLTAHLELVTCPRGFVLSEPDHPAEHAYFPTSGVGSIISASPEGHKVESGLFGREGFYPSTAVFGLDRTPNLALFQVGGDALRIKRDVLFEASERSATLRGLLLRFVQVMIVQANYTALSNAIHLIDERLARWLLMCHDRAATDEIALTHDFMSVMLAVRRPSVTTSLHVLEGNGFIRSERGFVTIRNRKALEEFAGDAYGRPEAEYRRLIG